MTRIVKDSSGVGDKLVARTTLNILFDSLYHGTGARTNDLITAAMQFSRYRSWSEFDTYIGAFVWIVTSRDIEIGLFFHI